MQSNNLQDLTHRTINSSIFPKCLAIEDSEFITLKIKNLNIMRAVSRSTEENHPPKLQLWTDKSAASTISKK